MLDLQLEVQQLTFVTAFAKTSLARTQNEMHVFGLCFSYTLEVSIHCVTCGQVQVVCFSEGWIYNPVQDIDAYGAYQLGVIVPKARMMSPQPSCVVLTIL